MRGWEEGGALSNPDDRCRAESQGGWGGLGCVDEIFTAARGEISEIMTVGRSPSQRPVDRRGERGRHADIVHRDVSSYFWLIRVIMSPALIYVVILPSQSRIDRS